MVMFRFDGAEVKKRRCAAGFTQAELGQAVGRSKASVKCYENCVSVPPTAAVLALSAALQCEPGQLFSPVTENEKVMT
jgi:transcriptional regulator with XRE-family HTH domain